jgi:hypothetical protein
LLVRTWRTAVAHSRHKHTCASRYFVTSRCSPAVISPGTSLSRIRVATCFTNIRSAPYTFCTCSHLNRFCASDVSSGLAIGMDQSRTPSCIYFWCHFCTVAWLLWGCILNCTHCGPIQACILGTQAFKHIRPRSYTCSHCIRPTLQWIQFHYVTLHSPATCGVIFHVRSSIRPSRRSNNAMLEYGCLLVCSFV